MEENIFILRALWFISWSKISEIFMQTETILLQMGLKEGVAVLPDFSHLKPADFCPFLKVILAQHRARIDILLAQKTYCWDNLMRPLEALDVQLNKIWSLISHYHAVLSREDVQSAYQACVPLLSNYVTELAQHPGLYRAICQLADNVQTHCLDMTQCRLIENMCQDLRLSGVHLNNEKKAQVKYLQKQLAVQSAQFDENVLGATQSWSWVVTDKACLAGLSTFMCDNLRRLAEQSGKKGWQLTLDRPVYEAAMKQATDRHLRKTLYRAYASRASSWSESDMKFDNTTLMHDLLCHRQRLAKQLGFKHFAQLALQKNMATSVEQVQAFLEDLIRCVRPQAQKEYAALQQFARTLPEQPLSGPMAPWDWHYYSEKQRQTLYGISQQSLRYYFPLKQVLKGLFDLVKRLFGLHIQLCTETVSVWTEQISFYRVYDKQGVLCGCFYLDLFARTGKQEGAWVDDWVSRKRVSPTVVQPAVVFLVCNFSSPTEQYPALLTHEEIGTLFHEFGHTLHYLLSQVDYAALSGPNGVEWDAVEMPSQWMEHWAWQFDVLVSLSHHVETGESLPRALYQSLLAARHFQSGARLIRQLGMALFDLRLHTEFDPQIPNHIDKLLAQVRAQCDLIPAQPYECVAHTFSHIFAGGYAASYYGYLWAEVLASDAFSRFEQTGLFDAKLAQTFVDKILAQGGGRPFEQSFMDFQGRAAEMTAFLRHNGIGTH